MNSLLLRWLLGFFSCVLASSHDDFYGRRYDHYHGKYSDSELMVDVLNNFGLRLLMAHNEHNENNIAFSPYGIGVILMALGEGLRGEALYEIRKAIFLPYDVHTIRVGLRDIHRHLKSYFIPKEGFLAGITLNSENVSINPQYIQLLKFYGYDINSFNTALYPESHITTTESGVMDGREETTIINDDEVTVSSTVYAETATDDNGDEEKMPGNSAVITTSTTETISMTMETSTEKVDQTTTENQIFVTPTPDSSFDTSLQTAQTTENVMSTIALTEDSSQEITTETDGRVTTAADGMVTTETDGTVTAEISGTVTTETDGIVTTEMVGTVTTMTSTGVIETTTSTSTEFEGSTSEDFKTTTYSEPTFLPTTGSEAVGTTILSQSGPPEMITEEPNEDVSTTANEAQGSVTEGTTTESISTISTTESVLPTSITYSSEETTQLYTSLLTSTTLLDGDLSESTTSTTVSTEDAETTTSRVRNVRSSEESSNLTSDEEKFDDEFSGNILDENPRIVANKIKEETTKKIRKFGDNDWSIKINNQIKLLNTNEASAPANLVGAIINNEKRIPRSIEEYVITRFYNYHNFRPIKPYEPDEPLYFVVNENNKEAGLDFMTYDTVLPFLYIPNPGAMALAFPLDSDKYYLLLVLPSETNQLDNLICKLYTHNTFKYIVNNLELTHVKVNIPSFSLNGRITLTNSLQKLGIKRIFEPRQADFSPMTNTEDVYVTNIEQAVSITIKNNLNIKRDTRHGHHYYSEPIRFNVNRPFLYFVIDSELQIILMTGKVVNPLNVRIK